MKLTRLYCLDTLKVALTILVIFHHAAEPYYPESAWPYSPSNKAELMPWIWHFLSVNASFFMGLFFLIAGYFVPKSFDRQEFKVFSQKKFFRLGLPLIIISTIISILLGQLEVAHLWYVESLLLFSMLYALVRLFIKPINTDNPPQPNILGMLIVAAIMGVGGHFIRQVSPQDNWIWLLGFIHIEPAHYLQYAMMFVIGILAYRFQWLQNMKNSTGAVSLIIGVALAVGNYVRGNSGTWSGIVYQYFGIYESLMCVFISAGLLWLFREYINGTNPFLDWCARQAYGAYIFHLFILLIVQNATDSIVLPGIVKFFMIAIITTALSFVVTSLICKIPGLRKVL
jgi:surface polysaccharide O-acyltransferase-like enzyme